MRCLLVAALLACAAVPAAAAQDAASIPDPWFTVSGTLLVDGAPAAGSVSLDQWNGSTNVRHAFAAVGDDGRFALQAQPKADTTNLFASAGGHDSNVGLRLRSSLDFPWRVDRQAGPAAPATIAVRDAATGEPIDGPRLLVMDAVTIQYPCVMHPGETAPPTQSAPPPVSGSPPSPTPPPEPRHCPLVWESAGMANGTLPEGIYDVQVEDPGWAMCNWAWRSTSTCRPYLPWHGSLAVAGNASRLDVALSRARDPDAGIEGYLISGITGAPLPHKPVYVGDGDNQVAVETDGDGSFRVALPSGTYHLSANLCGHEAVTLNVDLAAGDPVRQDITLPALQATYDGPTMTDDQGHSYAAHASYTGTGSPSSIYPACDYTPTPTFTGDAEPPEPETAAATPAQHTGHPAVTGSLMVVDFAGGLGPIGGAHPAAETPAPTQGELAPEHRSPGFAWCVGVLAVVGLAAVRRRLS